MGISTTTRYEVETVYNVRDGGASGKLDAIARSADKAAKGVDGLKRVLGGLGGALVAAFSLRGAKSVFIDFNSGLEQSRVTMAGIAAISKNTSFAGEFKSATQNVEKFQIMAKRSALTTEDLVTMASRLTLPLNNAGVGQKRFQDLTFGAANAAKAFRFQTDVAARDVQEALMGNLTKTSIFMRQLLEPRGFTTESFNALSPAKRLQEVEKALTNPRIKEMAEAQANTWEGVTSTLKDNLQMGLGKIGLPLFRAITEEVKSWNEWIDRNQSKVDAFAKDAAAGLVTGFRAVKDAIAFLVAHKDEIMAIGKVWLGVKAAQMIGGAGAAMFGGASGGLGQLGMSFGKGHRDSKGRFVKGLGFADALGPAGGALAGGYLAGRALDSASGGDLGRAARPLVDAFGRAAGLWNEHNSAMADKHAELQRQMGELDAAIVGAGDRLRPIGGVWSSGVMAQLQGKADMLHNSREAIKDAANQQGYRGQYGWSALSQLGGDSTFQRSIANRGQDVDRLGMRTVRDPLMAQTLALQEFGKLSAIQREALGIEQVQSMAMQRIVELMGKGIPIDAAQRSFFVYDLAMEAAARKSKKPPNTTIKIAKVEVSAKDPARWIGELSREALKQARAKRGPQAALTGGA